LLIDPWVTRLELMGVEAIAFGEVQKPEHEQLIRDSILLGQKLSREYENVSPVEIAVEVIV
jgi:hypothetical protein